MYNYSERSVLSSPESGFEFAGGEFFVEISGLNMHCLIILMVVMCSWFYPDCICTLWRLLVAGITTSGRRLQNCSLPPELLEVVKSSHPSLVSDTSTPNILDCCSLHPATEVLKLCKINLFKLFSKIVLFIYF